jgi:hypothetical protein
MTTRPARCARTGQSDFEPTLPLYSPAVWWTIAHPPPRPERGLRPWSIGGSLAHTLDNGRRPRMRSTREIAFVARWGPRSSGIHGATGVESGANRAPTTEWLGQRLRDDAAPAPTRPLRRIKAGLATWIMHRTRRPGRPTDGDIRQMTIPDTASVTVRDNASDGNTAACLPWLGHGELYPATSGSESRCRRAPDRGPAFGGAARCRVGPSPRTRRHQ